MKRMLVAAVCILAACTPEEARQQASQQAAATPSPVERGRYLVTVGGCHDCHTPKTFGPEGMGFDSSRMLSGHPAGETLPPLPRGVIGPNGWGALTNQHLTAWYGPWGVSYTANLTPHPVSGLGKRYDEAKFIQAIRTGKKPEGEPLLPPMPWENYAKMTDSDLKAIWAYLKTLKPVDNFVRSATPPPPAK